MTQHIEPDIFSRKLVAATFPDYNGRKYKLAVSELPIDCSSYWSGGSRDYFRFVNLRTLEVSSEVPAQSAFDVQIQGLTAVTLPEGFACIEHSIFCGKDGGITIHIRPENAAKLIPAQSTLTRDEHIVLVATRSLKSSYNGLANYRYHEAHSETGITLERWDTAKSTLATSGHLDARGALTIKGRNAAGTVQLYQLRDVL